MSKKVDLKAQLQRLQQASVVIYIGLAVAAGFLMSGASYQLIVSYMGKDDLASKTNTVFVPTAHALFDIQLKWLVVIIMVLSAIAPFLYLIKYKQKYQKWLKDRVMPLRWLDMGITAALMVEVTALVSGINDITVLKVAAGLMVVTCILGWLAEKQNADAKQPTWSLFNLSLFTGALPWLLIAVAAVATPFYAAVRSSWYVYALYVALLGAFTLFTLAQVKTYKKVGAWKDYAFAERNYTVISMVVKIAFAVILIVGLKK